MPARFPRPARVSTTKEAWNVFERIPDGWIEVPHHPALDPNSQITVEGWLNLEYAPVPPGAEDCRSIVGKDWQQAWWVGICHGQIRSYVRGSGSARTAGVIGNQGWTHFAVTFDGTTRRHYVNGELAGSWAEPPGPLGSSTDPVRIGSDVAWLNTPDGAVKRSACGASPAPRRSSASRSTCRSRRRPARSGLEERRSAGNGLFGPSTDQHCLIRRPISNDSALTATAAFLSSPQDRPEPLRRIP